LFAQMKQAQELDAVIRRNLEGLGYGEWVGNKKNKWFSKCYWLCGKW
jgi:hypothetical protein